MSSCATPLAWPSPPSALCITCRPASIAFSNIIEPWGLAKPLSATATRPRPGKWHTNIFCCQGSKIVSRIYLRGADRIDRLEPELGLVGLIPVRLARAVQQPTSGGQFDFGWRSGTARVANPKKSGKHPRFVLIPLLCTDRLAASLFLAAWSKKKRVGCREKRTIEGGGTERASPRSGPWLCAKRVWALSLISLISLIPLASPTRTLVGVLGEANEMDLAVPHANEWPPRHLATSPPCHLRSSYPAGLRRRRRTARCSRRRGWCTGAAQSSSRPRA